MRREVSNGNFIYRQKMQICINFDAAVPLSREAVRTVPTGWIARSAVRKEGARGSRMHCSSDLSGMRLTRCTQPLVLMGSGLS